MPTERQQMVMYNSPAAASFQTGITGWVSRDGHFYGKDEHLARWAGCTHKQCETCGTVHEIRSYCGPCRNRKVAERFETFPVEKWDGTTPLCVFDEERYFFYDSDLLDYLADLPEGEEPRICKCKPGYLGLISEDNWCDDLPEDVALPDAVYTAMQALNDAIRAAGPVCWYEDQIRIDVSEMHSRVRQQKAS